MTNIVIQASAGSGKTMQLSNSFLTILFNDVDVDSILASTFTRKAAGEITDRILNRLANAVAGDETEIRNLKNLMPANTTKNSDEINLKLFNTLTKLIRNLYKVRICTLDSFFSRIASTFFLELGFPSGWSIIPEDEFEKIVNEAIHNVLENSKTNQARKFMLAIQQGDQEINVTRNLRELASNIIPLVRESLPDAWDNNELLMPEMDNAEIRNTIEQLKHAELPQNKSSKSGQPNKNFVKARTNIIEIVNKKEWESFLKYPFIKKIIDNESTYYHIPIEADLLVPLGKFINHAKAIEFNKVVGITRAMRKLFDLIVAGYDKIAARNRALRFDDITLRLGNLFKSQNNKIDFQSLFKSILHRTNSKVEHLLLDEFQDTSKAQWNIIEPFVKYIANNTNSTDNAGNTSNTFLCVGDVKQAIYGWRGGVSEIFSKINAAVPNIEMSELKKSYRSCQVVIDTVNLVFCNIKSNAALVNYPKVAASWQNRMLRHETARVELDGYCLLETAPESIYNAVGQTQLDNSDMDSDMDDNDMDDGENVDGNNSSYTSYVVNRIVEIKDRHPDCSIGILVMKNREITDLMNEFRRRDINASEEGGSTITDSAAVQCILSAMQLVDHPDDKVARFHLVNSPLSKEIGLQKYDDDLLAAKVALGLRREIMEDGYGKIIERFVKVLAPSCNKREYQRLEKLLELAYQFQETASGARTKQFIKMINNTKVESPSASENIRVMTIFKSKGMQFDIVILPYLGSTLVRSEKYPEYIAGRENAVADIDLVIKYLKKNMRNLLPDKPAKYKKAFNDYEEGNVNESLSVLYVAMTRAIHELVMILKPKKPKKSKKSSTPNKGVSTLGSVLQGGLQGTGVKDSSTSTMSETDVLVWYEAGNLKWTKSKTKKVIDVESGESIRIGEVLSRRKKYRILSRITPSLHRSIRGVVENIRQPEAIQIAGQSGVNRELRFEGDSNLGREFALLWGKMIHACFEGWLGREVWLGEVAIDSEFLRGEVEEVLRREGYVGVRAEELNIDKDAVVSSFIEICQKPEIRAVLSRTRYASKDVEVQHERRFVVLDNERELMHGSIDRIVVERELGNVVNIEILDFKTDRKPVDVDENIFLENRRKFHEAQMEAYQRGMQKLYRIDRNRINVTLIFTSIGKAIPAF